MLPRGMDGNGEKHRLVPELLEKEGKKKKRMNAADIFMGTEYNIDKANSALQSCQSL